MQTNPANKGAFGEVSPERYVFARASAFVQTKSGILTMIAAYQGVCRFRVWEHDTPFLLRALHQLIQVDLGGGGGAEGEKDGGKSLVDLERTY